MEASNGIVARVTLLERQTERLDNTKADARELEGIREDFKELREDFRTVKHSLWAFALGLPFAGLMLLVAVLQLTGHH